MLPFDAYQDAGRKAGVRLKGEVTRREDAPRLIKYSNSHHCGYCGLCLTDSFERWRLITIDHVVPKALCEQLKLDPEWIDDFCNCVLACSACNGYQQKRDELLDLARGNSSKTWDNFLILRNKFFENRKRWILEKRRDEMEFFVSRPWESAKL